MGYNMDEPQNRSGKWKKQDTKGHILYDSIYVKCPEQINPQSRTEIGGYQGKGEQRYEKHLLNTYKVSFRGNENVLELDKLVVVQLWKYTTCHWIVHFKMVNFMLCKLHLKKHTYTYKFILSQC